VARRIGIHSRQGHNGKSSPLLIIGVESTGSALVMIALAVNRSEWVRSGKGTEQPGSAPCPLHFVCCGYMHFGVGDQRVEARIAMQRLQISIRCHAQRDLRLQTAINGLVQ
jgi:hypothetical protein